MKGFMKRMSLIATLALAVTMAGAAQAATLTLPDGSTVNYTETGSGDRTVILLHGWSFDSRTWSKVTAKFPSGTRLIAYDLRGFGNSSKAGARYDFPAFVADLKGLMDGLRIQKAVIAGHSLGALIAQDFAAAHPDRVEALVLTAPQPRTVAGAASDPIKAFIQRIDGLPKQNAAGPEWRAFFAENSPRYFLASNLAAGDVDAFLAQNTLAAPAALVEGFRIVFDAPALAKDHPGTKLPTLVVYGTHDIVPFLAVRQIITDHPDSCVAVIERTGHTPPWENPDAWVATTTGFLGRLKEPASRRCH